MTRQLEISASVLNLGRQIRTTGTAESYREAMMLMGVKGLQYAVVNNVHGRQVAESLVASGSITNFQQSRYDGARLATRVRHMSLATPTPRASLDLISKLQPETPLPVVVHSNEQRLGMLAASSRRIDYERIRATRRHGALLHIPTIGELSNWGVLSSNAVRTAEDMLDEQTKHGFDGVALDLHEITAMRGEAQLALDWCAEFAGALAAKSALAGDNEVRLTFKAPDGTNTRSVIQKAVDGRLDATPSGQLIEAIAENLSLCQTSLNVTLDVPPNAFNGVRSEEGLPIATYWEGNRALVSALHNSALAE